MSGWRDLREPRSDYLGRVVTNPCAANEMSSSPIIAVVLCFTIAAYLRLNQDVGVRYSKHAKAAVNSRSLSAHPTSDGPTPSTPSHRVHHRE
jgi:hypothetical protein